MKKVALNAHVRSEIMRRIMDAWRAQQHRPTISGLPEAGELRALQERRDREADYRHHLALALGTFRSVPELIEEWPDIEPFIPVSVVDPVGAVTLPELPS